jgi:hypothetical protein
MKPTYIFLAFIAILMYNVVLIKRDQELFKAYDTKCAEISHPHCHLSK